MKTCEFTYQDERTIRSLGATTRIEDESIQKNKVKYEYCMKDIHMQKISSSKSRSIYGNIDPE